jgi:hypothetical protein
VRNLKDSGDAFRVKAVSAYGRVSYVGPYATVGAAKGSRTRMKRYGYGTSTLTIEKAVTNWEEVSE